MRQVKARHVHAKRALTYAVALLMLLGVGLGALAEECTVTVQPGESIQRAIDRARAGATICLAEGEWDEHLTISKNLTLRGAGPDATRVRGHAPEKPVLHVHVSAPTVRLPGRPPEVVEVHLSGLTLSGGLTWDGAGVLVEDNAQVTVENVRIENNEGPGIALRDSAQGTIIDTTLEGNVRAGLHVVDDAQAVVEGATIVRNQVHGIIVSGEAQVTLEGTTIADNNWNGIYLRDAAQATVEDAVIENNGWSGLELRHVARATLTGNRITDNARFGVALYERPCVDTDEVFAGYVAGQDNTLARNAQGAVCPAGLGFLTTRDGGTLDRTE